MNIQQAGEAVKACYKTDLPIMLSGSPGLGKSTIMRQVVAELSEQYGEPFGLIIFRTSTADPSEIGDLKFVVEIDGTPKVLNAKQEWIPTDESVESGKFPRRGLIFIDELLDGSLMMQSVLQSLVLERELGSAKLASGWYPCSAANRRSDNAAAGRMSSALARRFIHVTIESDVDITVAYARKNNWDARIPAFLRFRPGLINTFEASKGNSAEYSFACEASWENLSKLLLANPELPPVLKLELMSGIVGKAVASEFYAFERVYNDLPDMKVLRENPATYPISTEPSVLYATLGALSHGITAREFDRIWPFIKRLQSEFITMFVKDAYKITDGSISKTKAWDEYVRDFNFAAF